MIIGVQPGFHAPDWLIAGTNPFSPALISDLTAGSSLDRSGELGARLWRRHFKHVVRPTER